MFAKKPVDASLDNNIDLDSLDVKTDDVNLDAFFSAIEKDVNGAIFDDEPVVANNTATVPQGNSNRSNDQSQSDDEVKRLRTELDSLKKRYDSSGNEAKRLAAEVDRYKDYVPLLDAMREDPGLISHVRSYLEGNVAPQSITDELQLPEDFIFDFDESIKDPSSPSAKVLSTMVGKVAQKQVQGIIQERERQAQVEMAKRERENQITSFQQKMNWDDEQMQEFVDWASNTKLTLDDIYYLKIRGQRDKELARKQVEERENQLKRMRQTPASLASTGSQSDGMTEDQKIFAAILKQHSGQDIFGAD